MDDIWASFYAQAQGHKVIYQSPSVYQQRNEHDLTVDFSKEVIGYENNLSMLTGLKDDPGSINDYLPERSKSAWNLYIEHMEKL
jgi:hypothetical protein